MQWWESIAAPNTVNEEVAPGNGPYPREIQNDTSLNKKGKGGLERVCIYIYMYIYVSVCVYI
jgi:hypothetical protein